jgi:hypothetical protein
MGAELLSRSPVAASWMVRPTRDVRAALRNSGLHNLHL